MTDPFTSTLKSNFGPMIENRLAMRRFRPSIVIPDRFFDNEERTIRVPSLGPSVGHGLISVGLYICTALPAICSLMTSRSILNAVLSFPLLVYTSAIFAIEKIESLPMPFLLIGFLP